MHPAVEQPLYWGSCASLLIDTVDIKGVMYEVDEMSRFTCMRFSISI